MDTTRIVTCLTDLEEAAEDILTDRQTIIDLDRTRNGNREALRHLKTKADKKSWIVMGNTFFKLEGESVEDILKKGSIKIIRTGKPFKKFGLIRTNGAHYKFIIGFVLDQDKLDKEINELRDNLKKKMDKIKDLEGKPALKGFNLKPLNRDEMSAIYKTIGK